MEYSYIYIYKLYIIIITFPSNLTEFPATVPVEMMRACPAILGSLIVPLVYQICVESGMSRHSAALAATLVLLG